MIELKNISFAYPGAAPLLEDVSISFPAGKITTILGPNGSGKSTLLKIAGGLLPASMGEVLLKKKSIKAMKPKELARQLAMLAQSNRPPEIEVGDLVSYGRYPYQKYGQGLTKEDQNHIEQAMNQVNIVSYKHRLVNRLSGGERQRAYIAMVVAQDTDYVLLDEPTNNLDIYHASNMMKMARRLCDELGKTVILVLHELNYAAFYSDYICAFVDGRIEKFGTVKEVMQKEVLGKIYNVDFEIMEIQGKPLSIYY